MAPLLREAFFSRAGVGDTANEWVYSLGGGHTLLRKCCVAGTLTFTERLLGVHRAWHTDVLFLMNPPNHLGLREGT